jgi:hypothetical protein
MLTESFLMMSNPLRKLADQEAEQLLRRVGVQNALCEPQAPTQVGNILAAEALEDVRHGLRREGHLGNVLNADANGIAFERAHPL